MSKNFEIRKSVVLEVTPEQVWHAIATPEGQAAWSPDPYQPTDGAQIDATENERLAVRTPQAEEWHLSRLRVPRERHGQQHHHAHLRPQRLSRR